MFVAKVSETGSTWSVGINYTYWKLSGDTRWLGSDSLLRYLWVCGEVGGLLLERCAETFV